MQPAAEDEQRHRHDEVGVARRTEEQLRQRPGKREQDGAEHDRRADDQGGGRRRVAAGAIRGVGQGVGDVAGDRDVQAQRPQRHKHRQGPARQRVLAETRGAELLGDEAKGEEVADHHHAFGPESGGEVALQETGSSASRSWVASFGMSWCSTTYSRPFKPILIRSSGLSEKSFSMASAMATGSSGGRLYPAPMSATGS